MPDINHAIQEQFSRVAEHYRHSAVHAKGADLTRIVELVQKYSQPNVLDIGCGAGHVSVALSPISQQVTAYDLTQSMLEQVTILAKERQLSNIVTQLGNADTLPFADATFDIIVTRYSAHHWQNPQQALREIRRVLKSGGMFLLSDVVSPEYYAQDTFLQTIELLRDGSHVRDYRITEWGMWIQSTGFDAGIDMTWRLPLNFDDWVTRMATPASKVSILKELFDGASDEIRSSFQIEPNYNFTINGALFIGKPY
jgi:ubiquinone/menaquinone biosynthesis C-methylase UbiE